MNVFEFDANAPKDGPWWFLLWEKADALVAMDEHITVPPTVDVPFLLHRDASAGIDFDTYPYGRGPRELALGMRVTFIPPEKQDGYRIADHDRRNLLGYCAEKLGFTSLEHLAAAGAVSLSIWYDGSLVYRVARAMHELGLDLPLLRGETAVQLWYEIARDDRRDAAPFHQIDRALAAIPQRRLEEAGSPAHIVACSLVSARVTGGVRELGRRAELQPPRSPSNPSCSTCATTCATPGPATASRGRSATATASTPSRSGCTRRASCGGCGPEARPAAIGALVGGDEHLRPAR